jgi:hypothetical protein
MVPTIASTVVDRPAAEVFAYATDPAYFHEWQQGLIEGHLDPPGPAQVGTKCLTTRRIGGANRVVTAELTHIDAPRAWGVQGIDGPIRATVDVTVEPLTETSSRLAIAWTDGRCPMRACRLGARRPVPPSRPAACRRASPYAGA